MIRFTKFLSLPTRRHVLNLLRRACAEAVEEGLISVNPAADVSAGKKEPRTEPTWTVLSPPERHRLVEVAPWPYGLWLPVAWGAGTRQGEMWALERQDVCLDGPNPHMVIRYGAPHRMPTKSGEPRVVPLFGVALKAMREWMQQLDSWCLRPSEIVFPLRSGGPRDKKPPRGWKTWLAKAGIQRRVRWHDLRHTCASALVSGQWGRTWSLEEVKELLGHSSITVTERYAHFARDALQRAAAETDEKHGKKGK